MASPAARVKVGAYIGTGSALSIETIGWRPRHVRLFNADDASFMEWFDTMDDDSVAKQKAGTSSLVTSGGVTPTDVGFNVGTDADLNTADEQVHYLAIG